MKKLIAVIILLVMTTVNGYATHIPRWAFDKRVNIEVVDHIDDYGFYTTYYCVGEEYVIEYDRYVYNDTRWIGLYTGGIDNCILHDQSEPNGEEEAQDTINDLVTMVLNMVGES